MTDLFLISVSLTQEIYRKGNKGKIYRGTTGFLCQAKWRAWERGLRQAGKGGNN